MNILQLTKQKYSFKTMKIQDLAKCNHKNKKTRVVMASANSGSSVSVYRSASYEKVLLTPERAYRLAYYFKAELRVYCKPYPDFYLGGDTELINLDEKISLLRFKRLMLRSGLRVQNCTKKILKFTEMGLAAKGFYINNLKKSSSFRVNDYTVTITKPRI